MTAAMPEKDPMGLLDLPLEILKMICAALCLHCQETENVGMPPGYFEHDRANRQGVISLCRVSKTLRVVAQPFLYHSVLYQWIPGDSSSIFHTIIHRPALAEWVKKLDVICDVRKCTQFPSPEEVKEINETAKQLCMLPTNGLEKERSSWFLFELLIALCPCLETVNVDIQTWPGPSMLERRKEELGQQAVTTKLKNICFHENNPLSMGFNASVVTTLLRSSPKLQHLKFAMFISTHGHSVNMFQGKSVRTLRTIHMEDCDMPDKRYSRSFLTDLITHAPNIKSFWYSCYFRSSTQVTRHMPFPRMLGFLEPLKHSLVSLDIDLTRDEDSKRAENVVNRGLLKSFTNLEKLGLDDTLFCMHRAEPTRDPTCLIEQIPLKLKLLTLRIHEDSPAWEDLTMLGKYGGWLPNLRTVVVQTITSHPVDQDPDEEGTFEVPSHVNGEHLKELFNRNGVQLRFKAPKSSYKEEGNTLV
ncbi:unnamed protein product [Clonostachys rosea]|uniref:F-box domain-containing protein n=1 Tax=Bionectria ochroleuca TaxID=29856 RepID=A0ABY6V449_BIOOC|nr:unnamed protein product [Clonostachys rosea]